MVVVARNNDLRVLFDHARACLRRALVPPAVLPPTATYCLALPHKHVTGDWKRVSVHVSTTRDY